MILKRKFLVREVQQIGRINYLQILMSYMILYLTNLRIDFLPERYNESLVRPTKLPLDESNEVMKELNLIQ